MPSTPGFSDSRRSPRVLIVEDHEDTRQMYAEFLSMSFDVIQAANGNDGLAAAITHLPDAIVTDMSLPGMDGFQMVECVRHEPSTKHIPVLCLSGYTGSTHEERARNAGCDRVVPKPCLPDDLVKAIFEVLAASRNRIR